MRSKKELHQVTLSPSSAPLHRIVYNMATPLLARRMVQRDNDCACRHRRVFCCHSVSCILLPSLKGGFSLYLWLRLSLFVTNTMTFHANPFLQTYRCCPDTSFLALDIVPLQT